MNVMRKTGLLGLVAWCGLMGASGVANAETTFTGWTPPAHPGPVKMALAGSDSYYGGDVDSDGDGVPDGRDRCPNTPKGVVVNADGCPLDSDGDGVPDYKDQCPNTPKGVAVDEKGCPDSDGDGVVDSSDACPSTPKGVKVDSRGCWVLRGITFNFNKADLKPDSFPVLDEAVDVMKKHPGLKVTVQGHTDNAGTAPYNQKLSEARARNVMQYLVKKGISAKQLQAVGFGMSKPIAGNDSEEGRALNRRVEMEPSTR